MGVIHIYYYTPNPIVWGVDPTIIEINNTKNHLVYILNYYNIYQLEEECLQVY